MTKSPKGVLEGKMTDLERAAQVCDELAAWYATDPRWPGWANKHTAIQECAERIRALSPAQPEGWVSVKDRVPPAGTSVLVYEPERSIEKTCRDKYDWILPHKSNVTHWMPLPAPPLDETKDTAAQADDSNGVTERDRAFLGQANKPVSPDGWDTARELEAALTAAQASLEEAKKDLAEILEIAEDREDIMDGESGPRPNDWMRVAMIARGENKP